MSNLLLADIRHYLLGIPMFVLALFLILLVLVQRGRGGGLTGALGGMGGQSAFGSKAGDVFTRITIGVAAVWLLICVCAVGFLGKPIQKFAGDGPATSSKSKSSKAKGDGKGMSADREDRESADGPALDSEGIGNSEGIGDKSDAADPKTDAGATIEDGKQDKLPPDSTSAAGQPANESNSALPEAQPASDTPLP